MSRRPVKTSGPAWRPSSPRGYPLPALRALALRPGRALGAAPFGTTAPRCPAQRRSRTAAAWVAPPRPPGVRRSRRSGCDSRSIYGSGSSIPGNPRLSGRAQPADATTMSAGPRWPAPGSLPALCASLLLLGLQPPPVRTEGECPQTQGSRCSREANRAGGVAWNRPP